MISENEILLNIKRLIKANNLTYEEFANLIGKTRETVGNYFKGRTKLTLDTLLKIAEVLNVDLCVLFGYNIDDLLGKNDDRISELEKENAALKATVKGHSELLKEKDQTIETLKQMVEILKDKQ